MDAVSFNDDDAWERYVQELSSGDLDPLHDLSFDDNQKLDPDVLGDLSDLDQWLNQNNYSDGSLDVAPSLFSPSPTNNPGRAAEPIQTDRELSGPSWRSRADKLEAE